MHQAYSARRVGAQLVPPKKWIAAQWQARDPHHEAAHRKAREDRAVATGVELLEEADDRLFQDALNALSALKKRTGKSMELKRGWWL